MARLTVSSASLQYTHRAIWAPLGLAAAATVFLTISVVLGLSWYDRIWMVAIALLFAALYPVFKERVELSMDLTTGQFEHVREGMKWNAATRLATQLPIGSLLRVRIEYGPSGPVRRIVFDFADGTSVPLSATFTNTAEDARAQEAIKRWVETHLPGVRIG